MSSTTTPGTWQELYTDLANRVRSQTGVSATETLMKRYIDLANQDLYIGTSEKLPWAKRRATLTTHPQYTTGTVAVTVGSTGVTGTSTLWTTTNDYGQANARAGGKMVIGGRDEVYTVSSVGGAGSITLATAYVGPTDSSTTYVYLEDEYALASDFARPYDLLSFDDNCDIEILGDMDFRRMFPRNRIPTTRVRAATIVDHPFNASTTPVRKVRFGPPPSNAQIIEYSYITQNIVVAANGSTKVSFTADTDEPIIPLRYRNLLTLHALYHWYRDQKDDARGQSVQQEYFALLSRIVGDQEVGAQRASVRPSTGASHRARRPYSRRGLGRYDTGGRFDRLED